MKSLFLATTIGVLTINSAVYANPKFKLPQTSNRNIPWQLISNKLKFPFLPPGKGMPSVSVGGAVRGNNLCNLDSASNANSRMIALTSNIDRALTYQTKPTLAALVEGLGEAQAILSITDNVSYLHKQQVTIPGDGVVAIKLEDSAPQLAKNREYTWSLRVICGETQNVNDPSVSAIIKPIERKDGNIIEQGIWYDALAESLNNSAMLNDLLNSIEIEIAEETDVHVIN